jgi:hypothetical protein
MQPASCFFKLTVDGRSDLLFFLLASQGETKKQRIAPLMRLTQYASLFTVQACCSVCTTRAAAAWFSALSLQAGLYRPGAAVIWPLSTICHDSTYKVSNTAKRG